MEIPEGQHLLSPQTPFSLSLFSATISGVCGYSLVALCLLPPLCALPSVRFPSRTRSFLKVATSPLSATISSFLISMEV